MSWQDGLPAVIKVGGLDYRVLLMDATSGDAKDAFGQCDKSARVIHLAPAIGAQQARQTMLHEVLHAIWDSQDLDAKIEEENAVRGISRGLAMVFRDNPALLEWLRAGWQAN